jgi:hypothetical protein
MESSLQVFGLNQLSKEFIILSENYKELAKIATNNQHEDTWTHDQLMEFLKTGEF